MVPARKIGCRKKKDLQFTDNGRETVTPNITDISQQRHNRQRIICNPASCMQPPIKTT
jgi:hypothetical protein